MSEAEKIFRSWLKDHEAIVVKVARAYTRSAADAQDLAQEILLQLWRSLDAFRNRCRPVTWVYRVALNTALAWRRHEKRRRERNDPLFDFGSLVDANDQSSERRETLEKLHSAIHELPPADVALVLLYLDELSYREMAEILGLSESNVGVRLNRAKKVLFQLLKRDLP